MTPQEIQTIHDLLAERVVPRSAREGVAILVLAQKLVSHFVQKADVPNDGRMIVNPTPPPNPTPDPTPQPPG